MNCPYCGAYNIDISHNCKNTRYSNELPTAMESSNNLLVNDMLKNVPLVFKRDGYHLPELKIENNDTTDDILRKLCLCVSDILGYLKYKGKR